MKKKPNLQPSQKNKIKCLNWKEDNLKNKGCKLRFVIFGHFRSPSQNNICEKLVLSSSKNPQKWFYVHLGRLMHINHRNYAQLSRNEVILSSTYFIASWKLEWEHLFFVYLFATCISFFFKYWFGNNLHMKILLCQICICMINVCLYSVMHLCIRLSRGFTLG